MSSPSALGGSRLPPSHVESAKSLSVAGTPDRRMPSVDKSKVDPRVLQAAEGFEAMFLDYMMKVMRDTVPESEMSMKSPATEIYTSMQDSEMAQSAARAGGVGLADQIVAFMESQRYTLPRGNEGTNPSAHTKRDTGGIHEGRESEK